MKNAVTTTHRSTMLEPTTFDDAIKFSTMLAKSTMVPRDFQGKPENILVAVQWGREIGLGPLQALQNIAVINGRPSVWGDAMMALVRGSGMATYIKETLEGEGDNMIAYCRTSRRDDATEIVGEFSVSDAKKAALWGKSGTWTQYPKRMLQLRARGFALRDAFPDVLRGVISAEEAADMPAPGTQTDGFAGTTITSHAEAVAEPAPEAPKSRTQREFMDALQADLDAAADSDAVDAIMERDDVKRAQDVFQNGNKARLDAMISAALARTVPAP